VSSLELDQITLDRDSYAAVRADARKRMLAIRRSRRVQLGQLIALEFENEDTLHYQVQEMVYAENITTRSGASEEIETYRRLLPTPRSISATLFLEFADLATVHRTSTASPASSTSFACTWAMTSSPPSTYRRRMRPTRSRPTRCTSSASTSPKSSGRRWRT